MLNWNNLGSLSDFTFTSSGYTATANDDGTISHD